MPLYESIFQRCESKLSKCVSYSDLFKVAKCFLGIPSFTDERNEGIVVCW